MFFVDSMKNKMREEQKKWKEKTLDPVLNKRPERKESFKSSSGIEKKRLFTPDDLDQGKYNEKCGFPGDFPYTRGVQPTMYRGRFWTMRQYSGFGSAKESNKRYKYLLGQGQTGLSVAFDLPTQIGYDSDDKLSNGEVGKVGVAIDTLKDVETLFNGISLDKVSTSMTINAPAAVLLAMYMTAAENNGASLKKLSGTIQNDILKEYVARGTYIFPPGHSMRLITDVFEFCSINLPNWNSISISGYHIREAGSTAAQEIGFTIANGLAYVDAAIQKGLKVDEFAPRLSFFFNVHNDIFEEVAKFRCARRIWANFMKNRFKAKNPNSMKLRFHTQTGGSTLTAQQPLNNIARVTIQAFAAAAGGTQSLHTNSYDEALALPTVESAQIALRTQQIIAHESGIADVIDPFGGSYYIESLTDELETLGLGFIEKIESMGGVVTAIETGYIQREIQKASYQYQLDIEKKEHIIVGMNDFVVEEEEPDNLLKINMSVQEQQIKSLHRIKKERDNLAVKKYLEKLEKIAKTEKNIMPAILDAVKCYTTLGEICNSLRSVFGEYKDSTSI